MVGFCSRSSPIAEVLSSTCGQRSTCLLPKTGRSRSLRRSDKKSYVIRESSVGILLGFTKKQGLAKQKRGNFTQLLRCAKRATPRWRSLRSALMVQSCRRSTAWCFPLDEGYRDHASLAPIIKLAPWFYQFNFYCELSAVLKRKRDGALQYVRCSS